MVSYIFAPSPADVAPHTPCGPLTASRAHDKLPDDEMPSAARRTAAAATATPGYHAKPHGKRTPPGCYWDGWVEPAGSFRRNDTNELYDADVARKKRNASHRRTTTASRKSDATSQQQRRAAAVRSRRSQRVNKARCNSLLFQPGFPLTDVQPVGVGLLGAAKCDLCNALLFEGEAVTISGSGGRKRGRSCCSEGAVELPPVKRLARLDELWRDETDPKAKLLREQARKFNNALALAYEEVEEPFEEQVEAALNPSCWCSLRAGAYL